MNARQAAKAAAKRIEELEYANMMYTIDVKAYNAVIEGTTEGKTICEWCEWFRDEEHTCNPERRGKQGCKDWGLMFNVQEESDDNDGKENTDSGDAAGDRGGDPVGIVLEGRGYDLGHMQAEVQREHSGEAKRQE